MIDRTDPTADALARVVQGQFELTREIGRGGMGVVYLATDLRLERRVAIKTLPPHLAVDAAVRARFLREARTAAALSHPGIVPIYHADERDGVVFFAMGYVEGLSLAERIAQGGPVPLSELVPILAQVADALGYAHARGVVHRDIKAENVLLDQHTGRPMITDFGIARVTEAQPLTATGTVLGTVHYMSPEQVSGDAIDGRSDLYALGVLAFLAATGRFPFERPTAPAVLIAHVNSAAPRLHEYMPDAPDAMDAIVAKLMEKRPADRFADAAALREALRALDGNLPALARSAPMVASDGALRGTAAAEAMSATQAQQVWARAAELQANTGVMTPPAHFSPSTSPATTAYDAALVKASAVDAGIDAKYVDRALQERQAGALAFIVPEEFARKKANPLIGARTKIALEAAMDGEISDAGFEAIVDEVRRSLGEMVNDSLLNNRLMVTSVASTGGRRSNIPRQVQVIVRSRNGRTEFELFENLQQMVGVAFGVGMGAIGGGAGSAVMGVAMNFTHTPAVGLAAWGAWLTATFAGARIMFARNARKRERELREMMERIAAIARAHPASSPRRLGK